MPIPKGSQRKLSCHWPDAIHLSPKLLPLPTDKQALKCHLHNCVFLEHYWTILNKTVCLWARNGTWVLASNIIWPSPGSNPSFTYKIHVFSFFQLSTQNSTRVQSHFKWQLFLELKTKVIVIFKQNYTWKSLKLSLRHGMHGLEYKNMYKIMQV